MLTLPMQHSVSSVAFSYLPNLSFAPSMCSLLVGPVFAMLLCACAALVASFIVRAASYVSFALHLLVCPLPQCLLLIVILLAWAGG